MRSSMPSPLISTLPLTLEPSPSLAYAPKILKPTVLVEKLARLRSGKAVSVECPKIT
jgi:hypothetical protein